MSDNNQFNDLRLLLELIVDEKFDEALALSRDKFSGDHIGHIVKDFVRNQRNIISTIENVITKNDGNTSFSPASDMELSYKIAEFIKHHIVSREESNLLVKEFEEEREHFLQEGWVKSEYTKVFTQLQSVKGIEEFAETFINEIATSLNAFVGVFFANNIMNYLKSSKTLSSDSLVPCGFYGINSESFENEVKFGEGIVGQCAKDLLPRYLSDVPESFVKIKSGVGSSPSKLIVVLPIVYENVLYGVFELAFLHELNKSERELLNEISTNIGVLTQNISQNTLTSNLHDEIAKKNNSLATQKKALDVSAIVAETDLRGRMTYVNDKFLEISKYSEKELLGKDHRILNSGNHPKEFFKELWDTIKNGQVWRGEVKNKAKDGSYYWVDTTVYPVRNEYGETEKYIAIRFDITDKKSVLDQLEKATNIAQKAAETKSSFLANMSHEIRTPLNGIIGFTDLLIEEDLDSKAYDHVKHIKNCSKSLLLIINDILDVSKIEAGKLILENVSFQLRDIINECSSIFKANASEKGIDIISSISEDLPHYLVGDPLRIRQTLINLIGNALKFTEEGKIEIIVTTKPRSEGSVIDVMFEVRDTGIGISPDAIEGLFKSFEQVDSSTTRKFGGTGLGLAISSQLVSLMGGELNVISDLGKGSCFYFCLELSEGSSNKLPDQSDAHRVEKNYYLENSDFKVLVVEDNLVNQKLIGTLLEKMDISKIEYANTGQIAIDKVTKDYYDLILMDVQMPELDGIEATKRIRQLENGKNVRIVGVSANAFVEDREKAFAAGMDDYLEKPINKQKLTDLINNIRWINSKIA